MDEPLGAATPGAVTPPPPAPRALTRLWRRVPRPAQIVAVNLILLFLADRAFGLLQPEPLPHLSYLQFKAESYPSNDRGYFDTQRVAPDGRTYWIVDHTRETDRFHATTKFVEPNFKIAAIGDSFTFGLGVRLADTYVKQLEHAKSAVPVYGITAGVSGANVTDVLLQIARAPPNMKLDLVIYGYVLNDPVVRPGSGGIGSALPVADIVTDDDGSPDLATLAGTPDTAAPGSTWDLIGQPEIRQVGNPLVRALAEHSFLVGATVSSLERRDLTDRTTRFYKDIHDPAKNGPGLAITWNTVDRMKLEASRRGARFVVAVFPLFHETGPGYPFNAQHDYVLRTLKERGIDAIDLRSAYDGYRAEDLWVHPHDHHPNEVAHRLAAERIEAWMRSEGLLRLP